MEPPTLKSEAIFEDCLSTIGNAAKVADFRRAKYLIENAETAYLEAARGHVLFQLPASVEDNDTLLFGGLSKRDVKGLYSNQMVPATKTARLHYDKLIVSAPLRRCPFCGFGRATTLDHFLNKSNYPWLAIVPINLIPACKDCNQGKGTKRALLAIEQIIHPYFESLEIRDDQWLFAAVIQSNPPTIAYRANPPDKWGRDLQLRVRRHFTEFDLEARFSIEAAAELASLRCTLQSIISSAGRDGVKQHLLAISSGEEKHFKNSWKTALYQALSKSDWYIDVGHSLE